MPRTKAQPVKKQRVSEEAALPLDDAALLAHAERVVQQLEANEVEQRVRVRVRVATSPRRSTAPHRSTAPTAVGPNPNPNPDPNPDQVEQWEQCVATPSSHIDFAAVPASPKPKPNPNPKPKP